MNNRIKELADQAGITVNLHTEYFGQNLHKWLDEYSQYLAELIVRDCINICEQNAADADVIVNSKFVTAAGKQLYEGMWGGAKSCAMQIEAHFREPTWLCSTCGIDRFKEPCPNDRSPAQCPIVGYPQ